MFPIIVISSILILLTSILVLLKTKEAQTHVRTSFILLLLSLIVWEIGVILRFLIGDHSHFLLILSDGIGYIGLSLFSVFVFYLARAFVNSNFKYKKRHILFFIIPITTIIMLLTNYQELFYTFYSKSYIIYGPYLYVHNIYTYGLLLLGLFSLLKNIVKNSGLFSSSVACILVGTIIPLGLSALTFNTTELHFYVVPASFSILISLLLFALFRFNLLSVAPIALQKIVDRISDGYIVLSDNTYISDYNKTLLDLLQVDSSIKLRKLTLSAFMKVVSEDASFDSSELLEHINRTKVSIGTAECYKYFKTLNKHFNIEINGIFSNNIFVGSLLLFKDITQHIHDMEQIRAGQDMVVEKERLASLGQMIGGIAHNLKTPIMSIAGTNEALSDLVKEYHDSVGDAEVTIEDHHEIAKDMSEWLEKARAHLSYMSDVITAIKGQAVAFADQASSDFTIEELTKNVNILMRHELNSALITLNTHIDISPDTLITGNINSLVQVLNNLISNAIQAYNGKGNETIDFSIYSSGKKLILKIQDYAGGLPDTVKDKLFKEMITTKGKDGTGLGLFMSHSNIRAHFNGKMKFETEQGKGTTFYIELPM